MIGAAVSTGELVALPVLLFVDGAAVEGTGVMGTKGAIVSPTTPLSVTRSRSRSSSRCRCRNSFVIITIVVVIGSDVVLACHPRCGTVLVCPVASTKNKTKKYR